MTMPINERIAADYRERIRTGVLKSGDRMPTVDELREEYARYGEDGVISAMPVRTALRDLRAAKLVKFAPGIGNVVA